MHLCHRRLPERVVFHQYGGELLPIQAIYLAVKIIQKVIIDDAIENLHDIITIWISATRMAMALLSYRIIIL